MGYTDSYEEEDYMKRSLIPMSALTVLIGGLLLTGACATPTSDRQTDPLGETLIRLQEARASRALGAVRGYVIFTAEVFTRFKNHPVSLIPLSPDLEAAVTAVYYGYVAGRLAPLHGLKAQANFDMLERYVAAVKSRGQGDLVLLTKTDPTEAHFEFREVPAGRWLLVTRVVTSVSIAYWAIPIEVRPGVMIKQDLLETNLWIEGLLKNNPAGE